VAGTKLIVDNRKSRFEYELLDKFEAGLQLVGSELKSIRAGQVNLKDSYVSFIRDEAFLQSAHISAFEASSYNNHEPERLRKLLLHREEIDRLQAVIKEKGLSLIPTKMYFKNGKVKIEIALGRGKKMGDKRESIKTRDAKKEMARQLKKSR
tara:strand:- start:692 stop:1147 length:456 start_codon:yes stop_codon:yes gene_type:complete